MGGAGNSGPERKRVGRPFPKGVSGNPSGRPKAIQALKEWLATNREERQRVLQELLASDDERIRLEALKHADAYDYGKPTQSVEVSGADGEALQVVVQKLPREE